MCDPKEKEVPPVNAETGNGEPPAEQESAVVNGDTGNGEPPPN